MTFNLSRLGCVFFTCFSLFGTCAAQPQPDAQPNYASRPSVQEFARSLAEKNEWSESWVTEVLSQANYQPKVAQLIMPTTAGPPRNWTVYKKRMLEPVRLQAGLAFWRAHHRWLDLAQERFGVPPQIVLGILGVESIYGRHTGNFRVLDSLTTLSFDFPTGRSDRSPLFRGELEAFLSLSHNKQIDPLTQLGSFAGAIGTPQFLPSSIQKYGVDFDGDERIDLRHSPADIIGSVANYLSQFGWHRGWPTHFQVTPPSNPEALSVLLGPDIVPLFSPQEFLDQGALLSKKAQAHKGKLALVQLFNGDAAPTFVAGTSNFYVITRYNSSSYYALAVIGLGDALAKARNRPPSRRRK